MSIGKTKRLKMDQRNDEILALRDQGLTLEEIAWRKKLTSARVSQIISSIDKNNSKVYNNDKEASTNENPTNE